MNSDERTITFFRPTRDPSSKTIVITSLGFIGGCEDSDCLDKADDTFVKNAYILAHSYGINDYLRTSAKCLGARVPADVELGEPGLSMSFSNRKSGKLITGIWQNTECISGADAFEGCTTIKVNY